MLRLKDIAPEQMPEVVRIASELYEQEQGQIVAAGERQAAVDAAAELGLPPEYLERAAEVLHARRVGQVRQRRRGSGILLATLGVVLGLWGGWQVLHAPPPAPARYDFNQAAARQWTLDRNPQSSATVTFPQEAGRGGIANLQVERFDRSDGGTYFVNLNTAEVPKTLAGYRAVSFRARGRGLAQIRLYLEGSATERWRSPALSVTGEWQEHQLRLNQFDYQIRNSPSERWRKQTYRDPGKVERLSFKVGEYVNDVGARGEIAIDDLLFAP